MEKGNGKYANMVSPNGVLGWRKVHLAINSKNEEIIMSQLTIVLQMQPLVKLCLKNAKKD